MRTPFAALRNMGLFPKLFLAFGLIMVVPLIISSVVSQQATTQVVINRAFEKAVGSLEAVGNQIEDLLQRMIYVSLYVNNDENLKSILLESDPPSAAVSQHEKLRMWNRLNTVGKTFENLTFNVMRTTCYLTLISASGYTYTSWSSLGADRNPPPAGRSDEIGALQESYDTMRRRIRRLLRQVAEKEKQKREAVLELARRHRPGLLIADVTMPSMDGRELLRECKRLVPGLRSVILICHEEFRCAQEAIQLVVTEAPGRAGTGSRGDRPRRRRHRHARGAVGPVRGAEGHHPLRVRRRRGHPDAVAPRRPGPDRRSVRRPGPVRSAARHEVDRPGGEATGEGGCRR